MVASSFHHYLPSGRHFYRPREISSRVSSLKPKIGKRQHQPALRLARMGGKGRGQHTVVPSKRREETLICPQTMDHCLDKEEVPISAEEPEKAMDVVKPLALQPSDRAIGDGWQLCKPTEKSDWGRVGSDARSCFLFLCHENRAHEQEQQEQEQQAKQEQQQAYSTGPLSRCGSEELLSSSLAKACKVIC